jgi:hypothetical protein
MTTTNTNTNQTQIASDISTLENQLRLLPTQADLTRLQARVTSLTTDVILKRATEGDLLLATEELRQATEKVASRHAITSHLQSLEIQLQRLRDEERRAVAGDLKKQHEQMFAVYKANSQRLLDDLLHLIKLAQKYESEYRSPIPTEGWNTLEQKRLNLPAINTPGQVGETALFL